jgi:hypothetical protein
LVAAGEDVVAAGGLKGVAVALRLLIINGRPKVSMEMLKKDIQADNDSSRGD